MLSGGKERETKNFSKRIHELPYQNVKFSYLVNELLRQNVLLL